MNFLTTMYYLFIPGTLQVGYKFSNTTTAVQAR